MNKCSLLILFAILVASCNRERSGGTSLFPVRKGDYYGFIDHRGNTVIPFRYSRVGCFEGGVAVVADLGKNRSWGYIDRSGKSVIKPVYSAATTFSEGLAFVVPHGGVPQAIDKNGIVKFSLPEAESAENFSEGLAAYSTLGAEGEIWGFINKSGNTEIEPRYKSVSYFSSGLCGVMNRNGEWGYINTKGESAIGFIFENAHPFTGDRAKAATLGLWGVIDKAGRFLLPPRYADLDIDGEKYLVKHEGKWGWIAGDGGVIIPLLFNDAYPFNGNKFAAVKSGNKWGYINEKGKFIIAPQFDFAFGFDGGVAVVEVGGKYGLIDESGKFLVQPAYDHMPVDYFIRYFAPTSAFYSVKTDVNNPRSIAYKWLTGFYRLDYDEARKYATEETCALLNKFAGISDMISDSTRRNMAGVVVGIRGYRESRNRAIVTYTLSDNKGKEQMLFLIRVDNKWLVQFSKNDIEEEEENENEDVPEEEKAQG